MTFLHIWYPKEVEDDVKKELLQIEDKVDTIHFNPLTINLEQLAIKINL